MFYEKTWRVMMTYRPSERERFARFIAGACYWLNLYRNQLNRLQGKPEHIVVR